MNSPVTLIGKILRDAEQPLAPDFDKQLEKWEREFERTGVEEWGPISLGINDGVVNHHEIIVELIGASGLPIEVWFKDGMIHLLSTEEREARGWVISE